MKNLIKQSLVCSYSLRTTALCYLLFLGTVETSVFAVTESVNSDMAGVVQQKNFTISGTVKDRSGEPIIGANVIERGTTNGLITNIDGGFTMNINNPDAVIIVSFIGYQSQVVHVNGLKVINVILHEDNKVLDEVVVNGYGTQRKGDITSAVTSVKAEDFTIGKIGDAAELIKGKVAGLTIAKGSGDPNATSTIRLRGVISLEGSSTPLILIDGIEGGLSTVAPENIESIDVLKDASAAAIYGTRGANGVILITTKTGRRDSGTVAQYNGYVSLSSFMNRLNFMDASDIRQGMTNFNDRGYDTDWLDAVTRTAFTQNHNFNISGGSKNTTYSGDVAYRREEGVIIDTYNQIGRAHV